MILDLWNRFVACFERDLERFNGFAISMYSEYRHKLNLNTYHMSELVFFAI